MPEISRFLAIVVFMNFNRASSTAHFPGAG